VGYAVSGFGIPHAHLVIVPLIDHGDIVSVKNLKIVDNKIKFDLEQVLIQPRSELNRIAKLISDDLL
jgi:histidine triad (HIT) family protein